VTIQVQGGSAYGISNYLSLPVIQGSVVSVTGTTAAYGVYSRVNPAGGPTYTVTIEYSQIASTGRTLYGQFGYTTRVAFSRLSGGSAFGGGTLICTAVTDANDAFYASRRIHRACRPRSISNSGRTI